MILDKHAILARLYAEDAAGLIQQSRDVASNLAPIAAKYADGQEELWYFEMSVRHAADRLAEIVERLKALARKDAA